MAKNKNKTKANKTSVAKFIKSIDHEQRQKDSKKLLAMMKKITGKQPVMWGSGMIGFGKHHYKYASGREGEWFQVGFSPRKQSMTLYLTYDVSQFGDELKKLGKHKIGKGCLYINKLEDVDMKVLEKLIKKAFKEM